MQVLGMAEGMHGPPARMYEAIRAKNLADIDGRRSDALTLYRALYIAMNGGSIYDMIPHLYTKNELAEMRKNADDTAERNAQRAALIAMEAYAMKKGIEWRRT